jgi:EamA domain-containing membrane protein RarD
LNASALAITNSSLYLGQFISPLVFTLIASVFHSEVIRTDFLAGAVISGFTGIVFMGYLIFKRR